jgi:hypothetical protein
VVPLACLAACTAKGVPDLPPPPTTIAPIPTPTVIDYSAAVLKAVPGKTTTTVAMGPGRASLNGSVAGPSGPVPGALVHIERLVDDGVGVLDVASAADGTWVATSLKGGRFRVRAWRPPDLALVRPEVFYLGDGETRTVNLRTSTYTGLAVTSAIAPNPPIVDEPANLVVQVVQQSVDNQGVVRGVPVPFLRAELFGGGDWRLSSPNPSATDGNGRATWQMTCGSGGKQPLAVVAGDSQQFPLDLPGCEVPPPTTTSSSTSSTTSTSTTSTSAPRNTSTTRL